MRIYEVAKELGIESSVVLAEAARLNVAATTASSGVSEADVEALRRSLASLAGGAGAVPSEDPVAATTTKLGKVVTFDGRTGKGQIIVANQEFGFDLSQTRIKNQQYFYELVKGSDVEVELGAKTIESIRVLPPPASRK